MSVNEDPVAKAKKEILEELPQAVAQEVVQELDDEVESRSIQECLDQYIEIKENELSERTLKRHKNWLSYPEYYLTKVCGLETLDNITPEQAYGYRAWAKKKSRRSPAAPDWVQEKFEDRELTNKTLKDDVLRFRVFLREMAELRWAPEDAYPKVQPPVLEGDEGVDTEKCPEERIEAMLGHLDKFEYGSREHIVMLLYAKTGRRISGLRALDVGDFEKEGDCPTLTFLDRRTTRLKEREDHEAKLTLTGGVAQAIQDYLDNNRIDSTDKDGREPLLSTKSGRIHESTLQKYSYRWTRPCKIGMGCPLDRDEATCEAAQTGNDAFRCPESYSPKTIRSGYVTAQLNRGVTYDAVSHRVGATVPTLMKHYDVPSLEQERGRYERFYRNDQSSGSGYGHGTSESRSTSSQE